MFRHTPGVLYDMPCAMPAAWRYAVLQQYKITCVTMLRRYVERYVAAMRDTLIIYAAI